MSADFKLYKPPMDKKLFQAVIANKKLRSAAIIEAAEAVMVEGLKPGAAKVKAKRKKPIDSGHLSRTVDSIEEHLDTLLEEHDLAYISIVVPNYLKEALLKIHDHHVELLAAKPKKR